MREICEWREWSHLIAEHIHWALLVTKSRHISSCLLGYQIELFDNYSRWFAWQEPHYKLDRKPMVLLYGSLLPGPSNPPLRWRVTALDGWVSCARTIETTCLYRAWFRGFSELCIDNSEFPRTVETHLWQVVASYEVCLQKPSITKTCGSKYGLLRDVVIKPPTMV